MRRSWQWRPPGKASDTVGVASGDARSYELNLTHAISLAMQERRGRPRGSRSTPFDASNHWHARHGTQNGSSARCCRPRRNRRSRSTPTPISSGSELSNRAPPPSFRAARACQAATNEAVWTPESEAASNKPTDRCRRSTTTSGRERRSVSDADGQRPGRIRDQRRARHHHVCRSATWAADGSRLTLSRDVRQDFSSSPHAQSVWVITETSHRLQVDLMPAMRYQVAMDGSYRELSDGNSRWEVAFAPRRSFARTGRVNLDLGVSAYMLGTAHDLNHGYYDPRDLRAVRVHRLSLLQGAGEHRPCADHSDGRAAGSHDAGIPLRRHGDERSHVRDLSSPGC